MQKPVDMKTAAQLLGTGPNLLFRVLREQGVLHSKHPLKNAPRLAYIKQGYFETRNTRYYTGSVPHIALKTWVTPTGIIFIRELLDDLAASRPAPPNEPTRLQSQ